MLKDKFQREITYLRISVTDRCNFRCVYCMPQEGMQMKSHSEILRYEDIIKISKVGADLGIKKIRITGGEPLIKKNLEFLIKGIAEIEGVEELAMTTNGSLLTHQMARVLKDAGLGRVNISLDTLDPKKFTQLTRGGNIKDVLHGIDAAQKNDLTPIKINMVIFESTKPKEIEVMKRFCEERDLILQTIDQFDLDTEKRDGTRQAHRPPQCSQCNRLRLTADGYLKPCLFSDKELKVDLNNIKESFLSAVGKKPISGKTCKNRTMSQIGG